MVSDGFAEYCVFRFIHHGEILNEAEVRVHKEALGSCLVSTSLPYYVAKLLCLDEKAVFRYLPCLFYSLMPAFVYLIARLYLDVPLSIISAVFILSGFQFLFFPDIGRIGIAQGLMAVVLWCLLSGHITVGVLVALLLVFSHYGTSYFTVSSLGTACVILIFATNDMLVLRAVFLITLTLGLSAYIWRFVVPITIKGKSIKRKGVQTKGDQCGSLPRDSKGMPRPHYVVERNGAVRLGTTDDAAKDRLHILFSPKYRDPAFQVVLGRTLRSMNTPQRMELALSWVVVAFTGFGLLTCGFGMPYVAIAYGVCFTLLLAVLKPCWGAYYAASRVYFASLTMLAPCFAVGASWLSRACGSPDWVLPAVIVVLYGMCVSGLMHRIFGINKRG